MEEGCSQFREEMEGHLLSADGRFRKLNEDLQQVMAAIGGKFRQNEGRSEEFESLLRKLIIQNQQNRKWK